MQYEGLKKYFWLLLDLFIAGVIVNLVFFVMPAIRQYSNSLQSERMMTVSAEGKTVATPDIAQLSFSVVSRGRNPEELATNNNQKVSAAIDFVKSQGVDAKDIKTTAYNLSPDYEYDPKTQRSFITGYTLTQTVGVKIRNLQKVASILGGLPPLGVNQISGVSFTVDDPEKFLTDARRDAFARAHAKAKQIAEENGVKIVKVINVNEYQPGPVPYQTLGVGRFEGLGAAAVPAPTIEPGTQELKIQVAITYEIE